MEVNGLGGFFRLETANQGRISKKGGIMIMNTVVYYPVFEIMYPHQISTRIHMPKISVSVCRLLSDQF